MRTPARNGGSPPRCGTGTVILDDWNFVQITVKTEAEERSIGGQRHVTDPANTIDHPETEADQTVQGSLLGEYHKWFRDHVGASRSNIQLTLWGYCRSPMASGNGVTHYGTIESDRQVPTTTSVFSTTGERYNL